MTAESCEGPDLRDAFEWRVKWQDEVLKMGIKCETSVVGK
jgi:hypothetical protein